MAATMAKRLPGFAPERVPGDQKERRACWRSDRARAAAARFEAETGQLVEAASGADDEATIGLFLILRGYLDFGADAAGAASADSDRPQIIPVKGV